MKIVRLKSENVKRLKTVEITPGPDGSMVVVGGMNGAGKSSVLDSIAYALGGKELICEDPIRHGQDRATIECDIGNFLVRRTFTASGSTLVVEGKQGESYKTPQTMLDKLVGELSFDPLAFSRAAPKSQLEMLRKLAGLDFTALDTQRAAAFAKRTDVNREKDRLSAAANSLPSYAIVQTEEVSVASLVAERDVAALQASALAQKRSRIAAIEAEIDALRAKAEALKEEANALKEQVEGVTAPDVEALRTKIATAEADNAKVRANKAVADARKKMQEKADESAALTKQLADIDARKAEMIRAAKMPVEGLSLTEDGVTYLGVPFAQASSAEQLRVSVAMGLAMNPSLKVLLIRDGSLLDDASLAAVGAMAAAADAQVWVERVGEGDECTVVIEDGTVAS